MIQETLGKMVVKLLLVDKWQHNKLFLSQHHHFNLLNKLKQLDKINSQEIVFGDKTKGRE